jgi:hypothetical protein
MWTEYRVTFKFLNWLCGGLPADPERFTQILELTKPMYQPPGTKSLTEIAEQFVSETLAAVQEEEVERKVNVFERRGGQLVVACRTFRAHIKDVAETLSSLFVGKVEGQRSFAVRCKAALYYPPEVETVPVLGAGGNPLLEPSGIVYDKPIRVRTAMGERSCLKSYEYVDQAVLVWPLRVLQTLNGKNVVAEEDLVHIFNYGGTHGFGPERGDGKGRYVATVERVVPRAETS